MVNQCVGRINNLENLLQISRMQGITDEMMGEYDRCHAQLDEMRQMQTTMNGRIHEAEVAMTEAERTNDALRAVVQLVDNTGDNLRDDVELCSQDMEDRTASWISNVTNAADNAKHEIQQAQTSAITHINTAVKRRISMSKE